MKVFASIFLFVAVVGCKKSESKSGRDGNVSSTATESTAIVGSTDRTSGDEIIPIGSSQTFLLSFPIRYDGGDPTQLPDYLSYTGDQFPGANGTCSQDNTDASCTVEISFVPTEVMESSFTYSLGAGEIAQAAIPLRSRFLFGSDRFAADDFYEKNLRLSSSAIRAGSKYVIADRSNYRVLIWNSKPQSGTPPDVVIGQPNVNTRARDYGGVSARSLGSPHGMASDGTKLAVCDSSNHRVLIWNSIPTSDFQDADVVLGQADFTSAEPYDSGNPVATSFDCRAGLTTNGTHLFVADYVNSRVLGWSNFPTGNNQAPDIVLGQADFTSNLNNRGLGNPTVQTIDRPHGVYLAPSGRLYVADSSNHRVLIWSSVPSPSDNDVQKQPDFVLGQDSFDERYRNSTGSAAGTSSANSMNFPYCMVEVGANVYICDRSNNRIKVYNTASFAAPPGFISPSFVLGQSDFVSSDINASQASTNGTGFGKTESVSSDGTDLIVSDSQNRRILIWNTAPTSLQPADSAFGQNDLNSNNAKLTPTLISNVFDPGEVFVSSDQTLIADQGNSRILAWDGMPIGLPDAVYGQDSFTGDSANKGSSAPSQATLDTVRTLTVIGEKMFVSDLGNNRILRFALPFDPNADLPDLVLGAADFVTIDSSVSQQLIRKPAGICNIGSRYFQVDQAHRVLIWNSEPTTDFQSADLVLGQVNFSGQNINAGGVASASSFASPNGIACYGDKLILVDVSNNRVLIWNQAPTADNQASDVVIGQLDFTSSLPNAGASVSANGLNYPSKVFVTTEGRLVISDSANNRVLIYDTIPTENFAAADHVVGQVDFTSNLPSYEADRFQLPNSIYVHNNVLYVSDSGNNRIVGLPLPPAK